jgi:ABC-2 type transport system ATP-binding protein
MPLRAGAAEATFRTMSGPADPASLSAEPPATSPEMAISVRGLKKHFGRVKAVDGLDLDVPRGSSFGFIGPNGAGKTTFIKLLLSIARPLEGELSVLGGHPEDPAVRRRIGYLPERIQLPPAFSPISFLRSVGRLKGIPKGQVEDDIPRVLEVVDLQTEAHSRAIGKFSKGMKQRTALAGALLGDPELLVLDEPTDGIDPIGRAKVRAVIDAAHKRGCTVFLNSHLLAETEKICDHVAIVGAGRVLRSGPMTDLRAENRFLLRFVPKAGLTEAAEAAGLDVDEDARATGKEGVFHLEHRSPEELSHVLKTLLDQGFNVLEVSPRLKDLEVVLSEAVSADASAGGRA